MIDIYVLLFTAVLSLVAYIAGRLHGFKSGAAWGVFMTTKAAAQATDMELADLLKKMHDLKEVVQ